jgi:hypothetical protein
VSFWSLCYKWPFQKWYIISYLWMQFLDLHRNMKSSHISSLCIVLRLIFIFQERMSTQTAISNPPASSILYWIAPSFVSEKSRSTKPTLHSHFFYRVRYTTVWGRIYLISRVQSVVYQRCSEGYKSISEYFRKILGRWVFCEGCQSQKIAGQTEN